MTRPSIDVLGDGGAAKEYNVLVIGAATESDAILGDGERKEEDDVAMKEDDELSDSEVRCPRRWWRCQGVLSVIQFQSSQYLTET